MRHPKLYFFGLAVTLLSASLIYSPRTNALEVPPVPTNGYIVDSAEILSDQEENQLNSQIQALKDQSTNEIGILTVKDGEGVDPAEFSVQLGRIWGVGTKDNKNGAVIFISLENPKRIQIGVSTGLEGVLTDALSGQIARNEIAPKFKESKFYDGLSAGVMAISQATKGEYSAQESKQKMTGLQIFEGTLFFLVLAFAVLQFIFALLASTKSWWLGGLIGLIGSTLVGLIADSLFVGIILAVIIIPIGTIFDYYLSKNYKKHAQKKKQDKNYIFPWYFGGGGGFGSGSSGGGFSGGSGFSGGGSFGGGGGGSSW